MSALSRPLDALRSRFAAGGLARDTVWAFSIEIVTLTSAFVSFGLLGRELGAAAYGDYVAIFAIAAPLGALAGPGSSLALLHHVLREDEGLQRVARSCITLTVVSGALLGLVALPITSFVVDSIPLYTVLCFVAAEFVAAPVGALAATTVQAGRGYSSAAKIRLIPISVRVMLLVVLYVLGMLTVETLGPAYLVTTIATTLGLLVATGRWLGVRYGFGRIRRGVFKSAGLYSVGITANGVSNDGDKVVLSATGAGADAGLYAAAYKIVQFGLMPIGSLISSSHNRFLEHDPNAENEHLRRTLRFTVVAVTYGIVFGAFMVVAAGPLTKLLGPEFADAEPVLWALSPLILFRSVSTFAINGLMGLGRTGVRTMLLIFAGVLSMTLYILLIPSMTWRGAVIGTLVTEASMATLAWIALVYFQHRHNETVRSGIVDVSIDLDENGPTSESGEVLIY